MLGIKLPNLPPLGSRTTLTGFNRRTVIRAVVSIMTPGTSALPQVQCFPDVAIVV